MEKKKLITIEIIPSTWKVLIKIEKSEYGNYEKNGERFIIHCSQRVFAPESDVFNWQEVDSLEDFCKENGYEEIIDSQINE